MKGVSYRVRLYLLAEVCPRFDSSLLRETFWQVTQKTEGQIEGPVWHGVKSTIHEQIWTPSEERAE
jgi:hypothetical protein